MLINARIECKSTYLYAFFLGYLIAPSQSTCKVDIQIFMNEETKEIKASLSVYQKSNAFLKWVREHGGAVAESSCKDNSSFVDDQGYVCEHWRAYDCDSAQSRYGYSADAEVCDTNHFSRRA